MNNFISFFLNSFIIFILSKLITKGYLDIYFSKDKPNEDKNKTKEIKQNFTEIYNYNSEIYISKNETCSSLGIHIVH